MATTIGNPLSWGVRMLGAAGHDIEITDAPAIEIGDAVVRCGAPDVMAVGAVEHARSMPGSAIV